MKELSNTLDKPDSMRLLFRDPRNRRRIKGRARTGPPAELCVCSVCEGKNGGREREAAAAAAAAAAALVASVKQRPEQNAPLLTSLFFRPSSRLYNDEQ